MKFQIPSGGFKNVLKERVDSGKVGSCDNQDCLSRADCDVQSSQQHTVQSSSRQNSSSRQLVLFLRHGPVPRKVVKFNAGLSQILSKVFLSMAVIKSQRPGISLGYLECGPSYFHWKKEEKIKPNEISSCLISRLLVVFTGQLEIL